MRRSRAILYSAIFFLSFFALTFAGWKLSSALQPPADKGQSLAVQPRSSVQDVADPGATLDGRPAPDFTLTDQFGRTRSLHDFQGKIVVLAFIDSRCTTVCPLTALVIKNVEHILKAYRQDFTVVAVNANPAATKVEDVYSWSQSHSMLHQWEFLTGPAATLKTIYHEYAVYSYIIKGTDVNHDPVVYVLDQKGRERWLYINSDSSRTGLLLTEVKELSQHVLDLVPGHPPFATLQGNGTLAYLPSVSSSPLGSQPHAFTASAHFPTGATGQVSAGRGQAALLEFFATWCPDCQEEWPALKGYVARAQAAGLPPVIAVDLGVAEPSAAHVWAYAKAHSLPFPVVVDQDSSLVGLYDVSALPTQVLVSSTGRVLWYHQGLIGQSSLWGSVKHALGR